MDLDAEQLDSFAEDDGWEFHDTGYADKVRDVALRLIEQKNNERE